MAEAEELGFNFDTKNGKEQGQPGRPSKEFKDQKTALELVNALQKLNPELMAELIGRFGTGLNGRSKKSTKGNFQDLATKFLSGDLATEILKPFGKWAVLIGSLWMAEEYIKLPIKEEREFEVDDPDKPIFETVVTDVVIGTTEDGEPRTRRETTKVQVGFEQKTITRTVSSFVPFPPILHIIVQILNLILPALGTIIDFLGGGTIEEAEEKIFKGAKVNSWAEFIIKPIVGGAGARAFTDLF